MKLIKILEQLNSFEKSSFLNIVTDIISHESTKNKKAIDKILSEGEGQLKNIDNSKYCSGIFFGEKGVWPIYKRKPNSL